MQRTRNVLVDNDVLRITDDARLRALPLGATAWLATAERPQDAHLQSVSRVASLLGAGTAGYTLWLLACHSTWQPDSRIVRHRKLWSALEAGGLPRPFGRALDEALVEGPDGVRFFGALQLGLGTLERAAAILEAERASHLVALEGHDESVPRALLERGWGRPQAGPDSDVLATVCSANGVVIWPVGAFDDREAGCVAFAKIDVLDRLFP